MNDQSIEQEIQDKGLTAPRVTQDDIEANIAEEHYFTAGDGVLGEWQYRHDTSGGGNVEPMQEVGVPLQLLTFCVLVLKNGFTVTGESACASPENFDADLGRKIARKNAVQKIWPLMGYALKEKLSRKPTSDDEYRMLLKDIPLTVIADFVDDSEAIKGLLASLSD